MKHYTNTTLKLIYSINIILIALIIIKLYGKYFKIILINEKVYYNINLENENNIVLIIIKLTCLFCNRKKKRYIYNTPVKKNKNCLLYSWLYSLLFYIFTYLIFIYLPKYTCLTNYYNF